MKKTLLSVALLTASGVYVAAANHALEGVTATGLEAGQLATASPAVAAPALAPAISIPPIAAPSADPAVDAVASPAPAAAIVASAAPAMPPLPRPRPADAPAQLVAAAATTSSQLRDGTFTGTDENAYYGSVQVSVTIANSKVSAVKVLDYPQDRRTSRYINSQALPLLEREVLQAQSAHIDTVSGATLTSEAYQRSLANALAKAGASNA